MKKFLSMSMAIVMAALMLAGCGSTAGSSSAEGSSAAASGESQSWPTSQLEIVVPYAAGGDTDFYARTFGKYLQSELGVNVIITNEPGANGSVAHEDVANSTPDGSRCLFFHDSMLTNKVTGVVDFAYETLEPCAAVVDDNTYIMAVNAKSDYYTLDDVVKAAQAKPGQFLYASQVGGYSYYLGRVFEEDYGVDFNIVDVGGGTDRNAALLAGKIDCNVNPYGVMKSYIDSGDFRVVCTLSEERNDLFPDVETSKEQGYEWYGSRYYFLSFPKGTDSQIVSMMADALKTCTENPDCVKDCVDAYCVQPTFVGTSDLMTHLETALADFEKNPELVTG
jgi:Uncharacterized protein conserved in bacteria